MCSHRYSKHCKHTHVTVHMNLYGKHTYMPGALPSYSFPRLPDMIGKTHRFKGTTQDELSGSGSWHGFPAWESPLHHTHRNVLVSTTPLKKPLSTSQGKPQLEVLASASCQPRPLR